MNWTDPSWRCDVARWIRERLRELGLSLVGPIEHSHVRPWGTAVRVPTDGGILWFKANVPPLAFEVPLVETIAERTPERVPRVLASDGPRGWLLMADAGPILDDLHPDGPPIEIWQEFLRAYAQLQIDVAPATETLVAAGVPDRRLPKLLDPLSQVLENDRLVRPTPEFALNDDELERLHLLIPKLREATEVLAALDLPDSVQHDDLHGWNVCVHDGGYRFIDWGDACISHPLLSLGVPLWHVGRDRADGPRDAYLEPWTALRPYDELVAACDAAMLLAQITGVLKWELINSALSDEERAGYEDAITLRLRYMLELACA